MTFCGVFHYITNFKINYNVLLKNVTAYLKLDYNGLKKISESYLERPIARLHFSVCFSICSVIYIYIYDITLKNSLIKRISLNQFIFFIK